MERLFSMPQRTDPIPELKRQLSATLARITRDWTTTQLVYRMRIDQPRISDLRRGRLERFSLERLIRLLDDMRHRIEIAVIDEEKERLAKVRIAARRKLRQARKVGRGVAPGQNGLGKEP